MSRIRALSAAAVATAIVAATLAMAFSASAAVFTDPSGRPILTPPWRGGYTQVGLVPDLQRTIARLTSRIASASFVASTTETMPVADPSIKGLVPPSSPPTANVSKPDRYEPDNSEARAKTLPIETSQVRTLKRGDVDFVKVPNNQGRGYVIVSASGSIRIDDRMRKGEGWGQTSQDGPGPILFDMFTPAGRFGGLDKYWLLKITTTSRRPIAYRLSHVRYLPAYLAGEDGPDVADFVFQDAVSGADPSDYFECTGVHASKAEIERLRSALFHVGYDPSLEYYWATQNQDPNNPLQRDIFSVFEGPGPFATWTRSESREGRWYVVAAGQDGSAPQSDLDRLASLYDQLESHMVAYEPVIYLYPQARENVVVRLGVKGVVATSSPQIDASDTWKVSAAPNGTLTDSSGHTWPYLFWEAELDGNFDLGMGSVVQGRDTKAFLDSALSQQGLSSTERAAFEAYWLPKMTGNAYNLIHFEGPAYEKLAPLDVEPRPDTSIRVFMAFKPLTRPVPAQPQVFVAKPRRGFTLVEWGGTELQ